MDIELALKYLTKSITEAETFAFENWLNDNEKNRSQYEKFRMVWEQSEGNVNDFHPDVQQAWLSVRNSNAVLRERKRGKMLRFYPREWRGIAAVCILLIASTLVLLNHFGKITTPIDYTIYSTTDSIQSIHLPDGSEACLNSHSELKVPNWGKGNERKVYLEGEAFFEVAHNPERPFIVNTSNTTTRVLGTSFNLKTSLTGDIVTLVTGKIKFCNIEGTDSLSLVPGEMVSYNTQRKEFVKALFQNKNFLAWKTKVLEFNNTTIEEALASISGYYHLTVIGNIDAVKDYTLSANFNNQPIEKVMPVLELTWDAKMALTSDTLNITFN
jgi:transmembrane sensor